MVTLTDDSKIFTEYWLYTGEESGDLTDHRSLTGLWIHSTFDPITYAIGVVLAYIFLVKEDLHIVRLQARYTCCVVSSSAIRGVHDSITKTYKLGGGFSVIVLISSD